MATEVIEFLKSSEWEHTIIMAIILAVFLTLVGNAFLYWILYQLFNKSDHDSQDIALWDIQKQLSYLPRNIQKNLKNAQKEFRELQSDIKDMKTQISSLESTLHRLKDNKRGRS